MAMEVGTAAERRGAGVSIQRLTKTFRRRSGETVHAIDDLSFEVAEGEFLVLLGPSGCGKTTLLRAVAGVDSADSGRIEIGGRAVFDSSAAIALPPEQRSLGMVFQSYALWPHMTAFDNVAFPLRARGVPRAEIAERVHAQLDQVGVGALAGQHPSQMSGGQQQRVSLARALVAGDGLTLFDEPLSNVDAKVRDQLRDELLDVHARLGFTAVYVTHDQAEAMGLASRILVLDRGRIAQADTPQNIYRRPCSRFVANFIGSSNEIEGRVVAREGANARVATALGELRVDEADSALRPGDAVVVVSRPEDVALSTTRPDNVNVVAGTLRSQLFRGAFVTQTVACGDMRLTAWSLRQLEVTDGTDLWVALPSDRLALVTP